MACIAGAQGQEGQNRDQDRSQNDGPPPIELLLYLAEFPDEAATLVDPVLKTGVSATNPETADEDGGNENDEPCFDDRCPDRSDNSQPSADGARP